MTRRRIALAVLALIVITTVACGSGLSGTTWKGGAPIGPSITLKFTSSSDCTIGVIGPLGTSGTYSVSGDQVSVTTLSRTIVFTRSGDTMTGAGLTLHKR